MSLNKGSLISIEKFFEMRSDTEFLLEYIDGIVYMSPSSSTKHQRVSSSLQLKLGNFLESGPCEVFVAPYDIELKKDSIEGCKIVIPDLSIICNKDGFTETRYQGVPNLIVEILSPSNQSHDLITKLNLYMKYGVSEYWIVNPMLDSITVYVLNKEGMYEQFGVKTGKGKVTSSVLSGFAVDLESVFG
ncbi:Uma2 family endonuclease [Anaerobacillus alkaliphilus]|uniref:Uma2 family endonuclease n=1 Tax=Anaerobacillus alkaliphilus TaxID=1548597 RepID=A0A4Q0VM72_9BACI|nr:Uma2 family endonuclease [Anaerobacillus alkaliphilus]RXI96438.1 Uma2 family endonuclease [Anaerobacillus alkaliphilus]